MSNPIIDLKSIFAHAVELDSAEARSAYLAQACGDNAALRAEIDGLLTALDQAGAFMQSPAAPRGDAFANNTVDHQPVRECAGTVIGPYKLLEQIGEGGMGVVYMADQQSPIQRRVALKIIKPGMDSKQVIARFEAERQALALMDHPNIAKVFDAGTTELGQLYFVMELVRGIPITEYCDQNNLSLPERLELFVHVCHAVQHAHQKGIIHRDLKPSNVMVTLHDGRPVPKVIDFGVAKAINQRLTEKTLFTNFAQMVGTPLYMSPEQAEMSGLDVDTRSDVYSLGVLLYELLTSTTPFDRQRMHEAAFDEIRRIIREEEPPRPSTRVSTLGETRTTMAAHRRADPNRLSLLLKGELDWVVMKALEKDRTHRYETANGLARDIQRYLTNEPVEACPASAAYRFRKFARRNRATLATVTLVAVALTLGLVGSTWQAIRATHAEGLAEKRLVAETKARAEADLAREAEAEQRKLAESERMKADVQRAAAEANFQKARKTVDEYFTLVSEDKLLDVPGLQPLRKDLLESALRFYKSSAVERTDDPAVLADLATTYLRVAVIYHLIDRNADAVTAVDQALEVIHRLQEEFPKAREERRRLGGFWTGHRPTKRATDLPSDGEAAFRSLMRLNATWQSLSDEFPAEASFRSDLAANYYLIGDLLVSAGQATNGVSYFEQAKEVLLQLVRDVPDIPEYRADLSRAHEQLARNGPTGEAEGECLAGLGLREQLVAEFPEAPQHRRDLVRSLRQYIPYIQKRNSAKAEELMLRLIELAESLAREYPSVDLYRSELASAHDEIGGILLDRGQLAEALEEFRTAARLDPKSWMAHDHLRRVLNTIGDPEKTLAVMGENAQLSPNSEPAHHQYGLALKDQGRLDEAVREFARGLEIIPNTPWSHYQIAEIRLRQNKLPEALVAARSAVRLSPTEYPLHARLFEVLNKIGDAKGLNPATEYLSQLAAIFPDNSADLATRMGFVEFLGRAGRFEEAAKALDGTDENAPGWERERALLYVLTKQLDPYRRLCRTMLEGIGQTNNARDVSRVGIQCKLAPNALTEYAPVLNLLEKAIGTEPKNRLLLGVQAHLLYRSGQAEAAASRLEELVSSDKVANLHQPFNKLFLAMAHHDLGHDAEAERYFREGADWIDKNGQSELQEGTVSSQPIAWTLRLELKLLHAEAEHLLGITQPKATPKDIRRDDVGENPGS